MKQISYKGGILTFLSGNNQYKTDYDLNMERVDGKDMTGEITRKDKMKIAQRLVILKGVENGQIKDYAIEKFNNAIF